MLVGPGVVLTAGAEFFATGGGGLLAAGGDGLGVGVGCNVAADFEEDDEGLAGGFF